MTGAGISSIPSPDLFFQGANAYQLSAALKAAIELDIFTAIGEGNSAPDTIAKRCNASTRGARILCDFLAVRGFLAKTDGAYRLTPDSALFLDRRSPAYLGNAANFLVHSSFIDNFKNLAAIVRRGGMQENGTLNPDDPIWVEFARSIGPMQRLQAESLAALLDGNAAKLKVLDIAAGHGHFGIAIASRNPLAEIVAVDWSNVLEVAKENARNAGVSERYQTIAGSAFEVDLGRDYGLVLVTNFLHHFEPATIEIFLQRARASMVPDARLIAVDFIPDENRVQPAVAALFAMTMLGTTPGGDAYTLSEYRKMFEDAGFRSLEMQDLPPSPQRVLIAKI
jgi:2-polyprenyl-3-methyl-5-hydroxy-6-metoxy-1,4-benzoquinol methylase/predicted transcriptional regulator